MISHLYLLFNAAIAISCLLAVSFKSIFKYQLLQRQILKSVRIIFVMTFSVMLFIPIILQWFPVKNNFFELKPFLKEMSAQVLQTNEHVSSVIQVVQQSNFSFPSIAACALVFLLLGSSFFLIKYIKNFLLLKNIVREGHSVRSFKKIHILFSEQTNVPFCWVNWQSFIILPMPLLENKDNLRFAIRHELQHLRQRDGVWLHLFALLNLVCFWNPFLKLWRSLMGELQEFSCDEALILRKNTPKIAYAQCLLEASVSANNAMPCHVLGFHSMSLNRRITMLFHYRFYKNKKTALITAYVACFLGATSLAFALENGTNNPLTAKDVTALAQSNSQSVMHLVANPEVVLELNRILGSEQASAYMRSALQRMKQYQPMIQAEFKKSQIPSDLLVIPLVESGYQPLAANKDPVQAAGVWQIIPSTGKNLGLTISSNRDDRMDIVLSTKAAIQYLTALHQQFQDWKLVAMAYEFGEDKIAELIKKVGSHDAWTLARSSHAPKKLSEFLALFDASLIIMQNPSLVR